MLEVLIENSSGGPPSTTDLKNWIKAYAVTFPVLADEDKSVFQLETKSVRKKMKDKTFARGVSRDDIEQGAGEIGVQLEQHIENVILGMREAASVLGLTGVA